MTEEITDQVNKYYSEKILKHGASSRGVDWSNKESHFLRFEQLCRFLPQKKHFSLLDFGCGFGSLVEYLGGQDLSFDYCGLDISEEMLTQAKEIYTGKKLEFVNKISSDRQFDYVLANGVFNVKLESTKNAWLEYILETLQKINSHSKNGFSFNILTSYSDKEYMREYLYYADPLYFFDYCKKEFSRNVALLHDYELYEFTILVKR